MTLIDTAVMAGFALANALVLGAAARAYHQRKWVEFGFMANAAFLSIVGFLIATYKAAGWPS